MKKRHTRPLKKLYDEEIPYIIQAFTEYNVPVAQLAEIYEVTRFNIYKILRVRGVKTGKYARVTVKCKHCGKKVKRPRSVLKRTVNSFCCAAHRSAWVSTQRGKINLATKMLLKHYDLSPEAYVHVEGAVRWENISVYRNKESFMAGEGPVWRKTE